MSIQAQAALERVRTISVQPTSGFETCQFKTQISRFLTNATQMFERFQCLYTFHDMISMTIFGVVLVLFALKYDCWFDEIF